MNKPDGITQEARIASDLLTNLTNDYDCWDEWGAFPDDFIKDLEEAIIAAIQSSVEAERRSIQTEVQDMAVPSAFSNSWQLGYRQCRIDVVDAIRRRKGVQP